MSLVSLICMGHYLRMSLVPSVCAYVSVVKSSCCYILYNTFKFVSTGFSELPATYPQWFYGLLGCFQHLLVGLFVWIFSHWLRSGQVLIVCVILCLSSLHLFALPFCFSTLVFHLRFVSLDTICKKYVSRFLTPKFNVAVIVPYS